MRTDENGIQHPTGDDPFPTTIEGLAHFLDCPECQARFPRIWALYRGPAKK